MHSSNLYKLLKNIAKLSFPFIISFLCLFYVFYKIDIKKLYYSIVNTDKYCILLATVIYIFGYILRAARWYFLVAHIKRFSIFFLFRILVVGFAANNVLPLRGGELIRAHKLGIEGEISCSASLGTITVERLLDGSSFVSFLFILSFLLELPLWLKQIFLYSFFLFFGCIFLAALLFYARSPIIEHLQRLKLPNFFISKLKSFIIGLGGIQHYYLFYSVFLSILIWLIEAYVYYLLFFAYNLDLSYFAAILVMCVVNLGILIPAAPGYIGTFELFCKLGMGIFLSYNTHYVTILSYSLALHGIIVIPITILGAIFLIYKRK